jgi:hypothetical protein
MANGLPENFANSIAGALGSEDPNKRRLVAQAEVPPQADIQQQQPPDTGGPTPEEIDQLIQDGERTGALSSGDIKLLQFMKTNDFNPEDFPGLTGGDRLPPKVLTDFQEGLSIIDEVSRFRQTLEVNKNLFVPSPEQATFGETETFLRGKLQKLRTELKGDKDREKLQSSIRLMRQRVGKWLEGGVLRKEDENKYQLIMPEIDDDFPTVQTKMENIEEMIRIRYGSALRSSGEAGFDISPVFTIFEEARKPEAIRGPQAGPARGRETGSTDVNINQQIGMALEKLDSGQALDESEGAMLDEIQKDLNRKVLSGGKLNPREKAIFDANKARLIQPRN